MYLHVWALAGTSGVCDLTLPQFPEHVLTSWIVAAVNLQTLEGSLNYISNHTEKLLCQSIPFRCTLYYSSTVAHRISFKSFYARCLTALLCPEDRNKRSCYIKQQLTEASPHCMSDGLLVWNPLTLHIYNPGWERQVTQAKSVLYIFYVIL